ncbi:MAG TPA: acylglycerol kinase family protein, partial [Acidimicrobiia bacterium]|nr:acylglycerol kinase family protein [Acidimicrobiia bacterium]
MPEPWLVLVNLNAGRKSIDPGRVTKALKDAGVEFDLQIPESAAEMTEAIASAASSGRWRLAVVGGDGTTSLAANAILKAEWSRRPVLGVLPGGTGGDLLRTFGLPNNIEGAAGHLLGDSVYPIDVGRLDGEWGVRYFVNVA